MRLENVVERYAPLTAAYQPKLTTAPLRRRRTRERPAGPARTAARRASPAARSPAARRSRSRRRRPPSCRTRPSAPSRASSPPTTRSTGDRGTRRPRSRRRCRARPPQPSPSGTRTRASGASPRCATRARPARRRSRRRAPRAATGRARRARMTRARARSASAPGVDGPYRQPQRERRRRVRPRLLHEDRCVRQRGPGDRRDGREVGPTGREHAPREEERREDRRGHHERLDALDRLVGGRDRMEPPERRGEPRDEAREAVRLAAPRCMPGLGDRAGDLRRLELVREDRRRLAPPGLPRVEGREEQVRADEWRDRLERSRADVALARGAAPR